MAALSHSAHEQLTGAQRSLSHTSLKAVKAPSEHGASSTRTSSYHCNHARLTPDVHQTKQAAAKTINRRRLSRLHLGRLVHSAKGKRHPCCLSASSPPHAYATAQSLASRATQTTCTQQVPIHQDAQRVCERRRSPTRALPCSDGAHHVASSEHRHSRTQHTSRLGSSGGMEPPRQELVAKNACTCSVRKSARCDEGGDGGGGGEAGGEGGRGVGDGVRAQKRVPNAPRAYKRV